MVLADGTEPPPCYRCLYSRGLSASVWTALVAGDSARRGWSKGHALARRDVAQPAITHSDIPEVARAFHVARRNECEANRRGREHAGAALHPCPYHFRRKHSALSPPSSSSSLRDYL